MFFAVLATRQYKMGSINIFKPLSIFLLAGSLTNLRNSNIFLLWKNSGMLGIETGAAGSGSKYANTIMLCYTPHPPPPPSH